MHLISKEDKGEGLIDRRIYKKLFYLVGGWILFSSVIIGKFINKFFYFFNVKFF